MNIYLRKGCSILFKIYLSGIELYVWDGATLDLRDFISCLLFENGL